MDSILSIVPLRCSLSAAGNGVEKDIRKADRDKPVAGLIGTVAEEVHNPHHQQLDDTATADQGHKEP